MRQTLRSSCLALTFTVLCAACTQKVEKPPVDQSKGAQIYRKWCAPCHAPGAGYPGTEALQLLYKGQVPAALEERTDLSPDAITHFVRYGTSIMPFFRKTEISDEELQEMSKWLVEQGRRSPDK